MGRVIVTGAGGQLGRDCAAAAAAVNHDVIALTRHDLDVTDGPAVERLIAAERPGALINCAAYTGVDQAETDRDRALAVNAEAAATLALATAALDSKLIYPSTDYVFDGAKDSPYVESDEPRPLSVYGESKLEGERLTADLNPRHFIVRSSWLFGAGGRNFVETMLSLATEVGEVVVVTDQTGCPTYTGHLAAGMVRLLDAASYGIHHMAGGGHCSWYELAGEIFRQAGIDCRLMSGTSEMLGRAAPRPAWSVLGTERPDPIVLPPWQVGIQEYLRKRARQQAAV